MQVKDSPSASVTSLQPEWERLHLSRYQFYTHVIMDVEAPNGVNAHTHGLRMSFQHLDFQVCLPLGLEVISGLFHDLVNLIRRGERFEAGQTFVGLLQKEYPVHFVLALESNREILRMILPDPTGEFRREKLMPGLYKEQWSRLGTEPEPSYLA